MEWGVAQADMTLQELERSGDQWLQSSEAAHMQTQMSLDLQAAGIYGGVSTSSQTAMNQNMQTLNTTYQTYQQGQDPPPGSEG